MTNCFCAHSGVIWSIYFPRCFATRDINTKITLSWPLKQFVTRVHTSFSIYGSHYAICRLHTNHTAIAISWQDRQIPSVLDHPTHRIAVQRIFPTLNDVPIITPIYSCSPMFSCFKRWNRFMCKTMISNSRRAGSNGIRMLHRILLSAYHILKWVDLLSYLWTTSLDITIWYFGYFQYSLLFW